MSLTLGCPDCGALQTAPSRGVTRASRTLACIACHLELERTTGRSLDASLACALSTFLLLIPANLFPFLTTSVLGVSRTSWLIFSASSMWSNGWPLLGIVIGLFVVVFPLVRFALLTFVLGALRLGYRPPWLGRVFRWSNSLQTWAMSDVFLLGLWVAYARLAATISVVVETGCFCFILAGLLTLFTRATLDKAAIWRAIGPQTDVPPLVGKGPQPVLSCSSCDLLVPLKQSRQPCPRCSVIVHTRKPEAIARSAALTFAALLLYIPANLYAIATLPIGVTPTKYTVLQGVADLAQAGLWGLAVLVFCASFAIPFLKLAGLGFCIHSVMKRSGRHLRFKTRLYRVVEEIGRWSMVDPFVIACFVPVMQYNSLIYGRPEPAAPAFTAVVVLTIIAAKMFDPRLMWDAAVRRRA